MHRDPILQKLRAYTTEWAEETAMVQRLTSFVETHPDCFERSLKIGHITGSAWLVNAAGTHVLLTHHKKLERWLQLGGHVDGEPDVLKATMREVREESGLDSFEPVDERIFDIDIHPIPARGDEPGHDHHDIRFAIRVTGNETYVVSDESHDLSWVEIANIEQFTDEPSILRMAAKWAVRSMA